MFDQLCFQVHDEAVGPVAAFQFFEEALAYYDAHGANGRSLLMLHLLGPLRSRWDDSTRSWVDL